MKVFRALNYSVIVAYILYSGNTNLVQTLIFAIWRFLAKQPNKKPKQYFSLHIHAHIIIMVCSLCS